MLLLDHYTPFVYKYLNKTLDKYAIENKKKNKQKNKLKKMVKKIKLRRSNYGQGCPNFI